ncbi:DISARM system helicase DrmA [Gordonia alkanivorans]|uniref:DISARM system helicase DrmA n=1 Tax=Gordonia alkanivorans TaxID=84096 RepID=UPI00244AA578|nr:DISARM system helicase DrmA [Gordonia alkanivorans]MDH3006750.1 DISARM system helicase DrmA [Gordonia alkanivorans]MDH3014509.1 DISARM system helicase DrmA [Gordonia alkanivorans]MDH3041703.1 DISARM system helicase DrmA [Gordonia alkanivorans]
MTVSASTVIRADLVALIQQELHGPRNGPEEEIKGTPRAAYMVGALAPVTVDPALGAETGTDPGADPAETGKAISDIDPISNGQSGVPVPTDEDMDSSSDGEERDDGAKGALTHPSSMGLRFQVPRDCGVLAVTASWGRYESFRRENEDGRKVQWSRRIPFEKTVEVGVHMHDNHVTLAPVELDADVTLRVELFPNGERTIVELALSNDRVTGMDAPPGDWLFQTKLHVEANSGASVFLPTRDVLDDDYDETDDERRRLDLQYRHRLEFAIGRTASVTWAEADDESRRATSVETTWLPTAEVPQTVAGEAGAAITSMRLLADLTPGEVDNAFLPLVDGYRTWLTEQEALAAKLPTHLQATADEAIAEAGLVVSRLETGLRLLKENTDALDAFRFMNRAMRDQRIRSQVAGKRSERSDLSIADALVDVETKGDEAASWRPFQLAFILLQLPALIDPKDESRSGAAANVELLFFPTGGGKTEAYLGLAAFTFAIRRIQGVIDTDDGPLDGGDGVAVLMRYTLRLLTSQQFQRAAALVCAAELIRQGDVAKWGERPFSIGLWVGSAVSPKRYDEAKRQVETARQDPGKTHGLTVLQLQRCPWCGSKIDPKRDLQTVSATERIEVHCGDRTDTCPFSIDGGTGALPITTVDDELYRNPPTFLLATVDKFARLAREGEAASLFGYVSARCPRHGYRHPDSRGACRGKSHNQRNESGVTYPAVQIANVTRLRPPDLIIQDELHLITGALGTAVGVFENAIDVLSSYDTDGTTVRPLIVASTATVRNALNQVTALYGRGVTVFPPQVLDVRDTFFSREKPLSDDDPGRKYLGVCAHGIRLTLAEIRMSEVLLLAGQKLLDEHGDAADPYMTTVDYFSATRELAGMRRYLDDDVTTRVTGKTEPFPRRTTDWARLEIGELTARISSEEISKTLDRLALPFTSTWTPVPGGAPVPRWTSHGKAAYGKAWAAAEAEKKPAPKSPQRPYDVVLATSMLQVGVDVPRLGLMLVVGQPKNTAEYIQASSRVGRDARKPGLVVSLANWSRPRDMSHFESFRHYHETFYAQVEALSVTPYSDTALERGLMGMLVSALRVIDQGASDSLSPEAGAGEILIKGPTAHALVDRIVTRATPAAPDSSTVEHLRQKLRQRVDRWYAKAQDYQGALVYERRRKDHVEWPLLISPETAVPSPADRIFVVANSMREVQPEFNLLVSPAPENLAFKDSVGAPSWTFPEEGEK